MPHQKYCIEWLPTTEFLTSGFVQGFLDIIVLLVVYQDLPSVFVLLLVLELVVRPWSMYCEESLISLVVGEFSFGCLMIATFLVPNVLDVPHQCHHLHHVRISSRCCDWDPFRAEAAPELRDSTSLLINEVPGSYGLPRVESLHACSNGVNKPRVVSTSVFGEVLLYIMNFLSGFPRNC